MSCENNGPGITVNLSLNDSKLVQTLSNAFKMTQESLINQIVSKELKWVKRQLSQNSTEFLNEYFSGSGLETTLNDLIE